jgi:FMNH2-dependent dimethyl sulfone monooxygenase
MQFGIWTPLPHTIRPEPAMERATAELKSGAGAASKDGTFEFACDVVRRADELGFDTTLIAERFLGPDLEAWVLASALAVMTRRIELMVAVHPGMVTPQVVAKMGASLDRISGGRFAVNIVNGWWKEEFDLFSNGTWIGDAERYPRMGEFIQVMKGLWTDSDFNFDGAFYRAHVRAALSGADGEGRHSRSRRYCRQACASALPADLCRKPLARGQSADRATLRRLVRRVQARLPQFRS